MLRFLFRMLGLFTLALTVIMLVVDATRTIAAGAPVTTPLIESWAAVSPETLSALRAIVEAGVHPAVWAGLSTYVLGLPGFAVFGALALVFGILGRRPERKIGRFAVEG
ncbi:MAG: hypothetical protein AB7I79_23800 [Rhizobiaceae bacterium]